MKYSIIFLLVVMTACEPRNFDRDKRQIIVKDLARQQLHGKAGFDITGFREDTLQDWPDPMIIHPIRYTLDIVFNDSLGNMQNRKGEVIFTPGGNDILKNEIVEGPLTDQ